MSQEAKEVVKDLIPIIEMLLYALPEKSGTKNLLAGQLKHVKSKYGIL